MPVFVPLELLDGWIKAVVSVSPITAMPTAGRLLVAGEPALVGPAFTFGAASAAILALWALIGLRGAERAG